MLNIKKKLFFCILGNAISLLIVLILILTTEISGSYWNFGPSQGLILISIRINTWIKYFILLGVITTINTIKVLSEDIGIPILSFNIYNPDKRVISDFSKTELQVMANTMFLIGSIRELLLLLVTISQVDIALYDVLIKNIASFYTINLLLREKNFINSTFIDIELGLIN